MQSTVCNEQIFLPLTALQMDVVFKSTNRFNVFTTSAIADHPIPPSLTKPLNIKGIGSKIKLLTKFPVVKLRFFRKESVRDGVPAKAF